MYTDKKVYFVLLEKNLCSDLLFLYSWVFYTQINNFYHIADNIPSALTKSSLGGYSFMK